jgi:hypothetical protein
MEMGISMMLDNTMADQERQDHLPMESRLEMHRIRLDLRSRDTISLIVDYCMHLLLNNASDVRMLLIAVGCLKSGVT